MKPITNGQRGMSRLVNTDLDNVRPEKSLTVPLKSAYGRDNYGHRTCRDRQKGHKRLTELSISRETARMVSRQPLSVSSTIQTEVQTSH